MVARAHLRGAGGDVRRRLVAVADAPSPARPRHRRAPVRAQRPEGGADPGQALGLSRRRAARAPALARRREHRRRRALPPRTRAEAGCVRLALARRRQRVRRRRASPRLRVPALARVPRARRAGRLPRPGRGRPARGDRAGADRAPRHLRGRLGALPARQPGRRGRPRRRRGDGAGTGPRRRLHRARPPGDGVAPDPPSGCPRPRARLRRETGPRRARVRRRRRARARGRPPDLRDLPLAPVRGLPPRPRAGRAPRGSADRDGARGAGRAGGGVPRLAAPGRPRHPLARSGRRGAAARVSAVRRTARRLLGHELPAGPRGVRPRGCGRGGGAPVRPARRPRAAAALGGLRARRLPRRRGGDARAAALRGLLRPDLDLAVAPRRRLLAAGVLVRRRLRRAGRRCYEGWSCPRRSSAGSRCSSPTRASSRTGSRRAARPS